MNEKGIVDRIVASFKKDDKCVGRFCELCIGSMKMGSSVDITLESVDRRGVVLDFGMKGGEFEIDGEVKKVMGRVVKGIGVRSDWQSMGKFSQKEFGEEVVHWQVLFRWEVGDERKGFEDVQEILEQEGVI